MTKPATFACLLSLFLLPALSFADAVPITDGPSIQKALDAQPGRMQFLPAGDYEIEAPIHITGSSSGLYGPGRIIQKNAQAAIVEIVNATDVEIRGLTLTRPEGAQDTYSAGIYVNNSHNVTLSDLQVIDNRSDSASILAESGEALQIRNCLVQNYSRISIDDRTKSSNYGYAFHCINGTGIIVKNVVQVAIIGNRIIEKLMLPTPEIKAKYSLGTFAKKNPQKGRIVGQEAWDANYVNNWHQGSALQVTGPEISDYVQIIANYVENAAQGIDIHADHVIMAQNIVNNAFMGMKAMHGSRNLILEGNQFSKNDLWSIGLMPGSTSHSAAALSSAGVPAPTNLDGYSIVANNIVSDFGYGNAHWMWSENGAPIRFDHGQLPTNPRLTGVLVHGNILYDTGRDQIITDGKVVVAPPCYDYAVTVAQGDDGPTEIHFSDNLFPTGKQAVANTELKP